MPTEQIIDTNSFIDNEPQFISGHKPGDVCFGCEICFIPNPKFKGYKNKHESYLQPVLNKMMNEAIKQELANVDISPKEQIIDGILHYELHGEMVPYCQQELTRRLIEARGRVKVCVEVMLVDAEKPIGCEEA